jgi:AcrR family transcriptional regulator
LSGPTQRRPRGVKRKRRSSEEILNRIIKAASEEFRRCGFAGATTASISHRAEVTEAQLFRYFGTKSNLFRETIFKPLDQHFRHFIDEHLPEIGQPASDREMTNLYSTELQRFISQNCELFTSLMVAQTYDSDTAHGVSVIDSLGTYFDRCASMMTLRLKGKPRVDPRLLVRVSFITVLASVMFRDRIFPPGLARDETIAAAVTDFVLDGIGANSTKE